MAWVVDTALPFSWTGYIYFSPIVNGEVYVTAHQEFWKYNIVTKVWTPLASSNYDAAAYHMLSLSPNGLKLARPSEVYGSYNKRLEIYTIATNTWVPSAIVPGAWRSTSCVWADDDTLWVWITDNAGNFKCAKYVVSTNTWTVYTNSVAMVVPTTCGINDAKTIVYGATHKYTIAIDTYAAHGLLPASRSFLRDSDNARLWYRRDSNLRPGYILCNDESTVDDVFSENTDREADHPHRIGVRDDLLLIIGDARPSTPPELMSEMLITSPEVTTDAASSVLSAQATPNGTLDGDGGEACDCGFEWGETAAYGNTTPTQSRTTGQTFAQTISGLDPNKTYHFRAFATNTTGTSYGVDRTFTTPIAVSTVTTDAATGLAPVLATLNGTLDDDGGEACECGFEWGLDTGYGTITPTESKTSGETFSQVIGGLMPNTTYHFRAFAINSVGPGYGADRSFASAQVISMAYALARREL